MTPADLQRTIAGKAVQHNVTGQSIGPPALIANLLYAEIMDSDLLDAASRIAVLRRIEGVFGRTEGPTDEGEAGQAVTPLRPSPEGPAGVAAKSEPPAIAYTPSTEQAVKEETRESRREQLTSAGLAGIATLLGVSVTVIAASSTSNLDLSSTLAAVVDTVIAMIATLAATILSLRDRRRVREETIKSEDVDSFVSDYYRSMISEMARGRGGAVSQPSTSGGADFRVDLDDGTSMLVQVKRHIDRRSLKNETARIQKTGKTSESLPYVLVIAEPPPRDAMRDLIADLPANILLMTPEDFFQTLNDNKTTGRTRLKRGDISPDSPPS